MTTTNNQSITTGSAGRIAAFDLIRGYLILVIASVHLSYYPSLLGALDGRGQLWVGEAEGFFFISGLLIGLIRRRDIERSGLKTAVVKVLKRGWRLYSAAIVLAIFYVLWGRWLVGVSPQSVKDGLDTTSPWWSLGGRILVLTYNYGWSDFLIYYAGFLFVTPLVLWLLKRRLWWIVLTATLGVWYWRWTGGFGPYNPFLQWQVYFFLGAIIGYYWQTLAAVFDGWSVGLRRWLQGGSVVLTAIIMTLSALAVFGPTVSTKWWLEWVGPLNASTTYANLLVDGRIGLLRPAILLVVFAGVFTFVRRFESQIIRYLGWLLLPFGKNSLYVYILESLALFTVPFFFKPGSFWLNSTIEIVIIALVWLSVRNRLLFKIIPR